jgi:hypothetical protein
LKYLINYFFRLILIELFIEMCDNIIHINIPIPDILSDITKYTRSCYAKEGDIKKFNSNFLIEFNELLQNE